MIRQALGVEVVGIVEGGEGDVGFAGGLAGGEVEVYLEVGPVLAEREGLVRHYNCGQ